ncbi:MAG: Fic family protein [Muribaculaceae bacterium]|nr:Fic family protein [Muribaculaceae bacterium]
MYIHEYDNWPNFRWANDQIALLLDTASRAQGLLYGRLSNLGFDDKLKAIAENLTIDVVQSSEIEGIHLNSEDVRSSIARRLGIESIKQNDSSSHYIDGVVNVMIDAMEHYDRELTKETLCAWQSAFFPTGYSGGSKIEVGCYRTHEEHIVSGYLGRERVHYVAPSPQRVEEEMKRFIDWFNDATGESYIIRSAIAHLWFVSIHPFEDGNGRLSRILSDIMLARGDQSQLRFYNMSTAINKDKRHYYSILERVQHNDGDITDWLVWYLNILISSIDDANAIVSTVLNKSLFWMKASAIPLSDRQTKTLNKFLDGYEAKITTKTWASLNKCSKDTAIRDIKDLVEKGILHEDIPGAKRPSYSIYIDNNTTQAFSDVHIVEEEGNYYLNGKYKNDKVIHERILALDAERYLSGDIPINHLIVKYCSYLNS